MKSSENKRILNVNEVSERLKIHPETVRKMFRQKEIPAFKIRNGWRVKETDLLDWLEKQTIGG